MLKKLAKSGKMNQSGLTNKTGRSDATAKSRSRSRIVLHMPHKDPPMHTCYKGMGNKFGRFYDNDDLSCAIQMSTSESVREKAELDKKYSA